MSNDSDGYGDPMYGDSDYEDLTPEGLGYENAGLDDYPPPLGSQVNSCLTKSLRQVAMTVGITVGMWSMETLSRVI